MAFHLPLALAAATLVASPGAGTTAPPGEGAGTKAETFAASSGQVLGAAQACGVEKARLDAAARNVGKAVQGTVADQKELTSAHDRFIGGVAAGRQSVTSGATDCQAAGTHLSELERTVQQESAPGSSR